VAACAQNDKLRSTSAAIRTQSRSGRRNLEPTAYPAGETGRPASRRSLRVERDPGERERQLSALPRRSIPSSRRSAIHVRRDKAALFFQWVQAPPGDRSSRKRPEQAWRRRSV